MRNDEPQSQKVLHRAHQPQHDSHRTLVHDDKPRIWVSLAIMPF
jgi:hypothetical protein